MLEIKYGDNNFEMLVDNLSRIKAFSQLWFQKLTSFYEVKEVRKFRFATAMLVTTLSW